MTERTRHAEWLSLVETSGPFLAVPVLDEAFPQGLDRNESRVRQKLRAAYDEWQEAIDRADPQLDEIHGAWILFVLRKVLEFDDASLKVRSVGDASYSDRETGVAIESDFTVVSGGVRRLLVAVCSPGTDLEAARAGDGWIASMAERLVLLCRASGTRLGLITNGERWMLVDAAPSGITGRTSWYARLWFQEPITLQAFQSLLSVRRFFGPPESSLEALLTASLKHQDEITDTLGQQVKRAVEVLVQALDRADIDRNRELLRDVKPAQLYEAGLTVMMRLVFTLCAEERGLLLLGDPVYDTSYAVSAIRAQLHEEADRAGVEVLERRHDAWSRLLATFRVVFGGIEHESLRLPALGGSLFDPDRYPFLEGRQAGTTWRTAPATPLPIDNRTVLLLLSALQVLERPTGAQSLSYRSLDVEQIGHVYEGLLEHTVSRVPEITIGLVGSSSAKDPNITLRELEGLRQAGETRLLAALKDQTGRSEAALRSALSREADPLILSGLRTMVGKDEGLLRRLVPFANVVRLDAWGNPVVYGAQSFAITLGADRRETGTHYTPRPLTEAIVEQTLTPIVFKGPKEGISREKWALRPPQELLDLKVCDPAMGSGAFLVQICRWLADRLVESWAQEERAGRVVGIDGKAATHASESLPPDSDERRLLARRLVAERCLYGVDLNPLAVELAKLSLWLVTLSKGRPFGFLDHNLRRGDSLLGVSQLKQLVELSLEPKGSGSQMRVFGAGLSAAVAKSTKLRQDLRATPIRDIRDVEAMASLDAEARTSTHAAELVADALIGTSLRHSGNERGLAASLQALTIDASRALEGDSEALTAVAAGSAGLSADLPPGKTPRHPFHWPLEFPEVFDRTESGFDAIVGNPPFLGGRKITGIMGEAYREYLVGHIAAGTRGSSADLVTYFFLRMFALLRESGCLGLLAVNTIAEGDSRQVGLERILKFGGSIFAAYPNEPWPGKAAVVTSRVHLTRGRWTAPRNLAGRTVPFISAFLSDEEETSPKQLKVNAGKSFQGSIVLGMGFVVDEAQAREWLAEAPSSKEVLFPFLNGEDLNTDPEQRPSRWVVNFWDWPEERAKRHRHAYEWISQHVKPERQRKDDAGEYVLRKPLPQRWWHYADKRPALYHAIGMGQFFENHPDGWSDRAAMPERVLAIAAASKTVAFVAVKPEIVFSHATFVFSESQWWKFACLQSVVHVSWAWKHGSTLKTDLRYTPSDVFETFPFPQPAQTEPLDNLGRRFHENRAAATRRFAVGMTQLYGRINDTSDNDPAIVELRELQRTMDEAIVAAYEWSDLALGHDFHRVAYLPAPDNLRYTVREEARLEILRRLAKLNRERSSQEEAEPSAQGRRKGRRSKRTSSASDLLEF